MTHVPVPSKHLTDGSEFRIKKSMKKTCITRVLDALLGSIAYPLVAFCVFHVFL
jgi:hypothetical protein